MDEILGSVRGACDAGCQGRGGCGVLEVGLAGARGVEAVV